MAGTGSSRKQFPVRLHQQLEQYEYRLPGTIPGSLVFRYPARLGQSANRLPAIHGKRRRLDRLPLCRLCTHPSAYPQNWDWYHNQFIGAGQYKGNTWRPTSAVLRVEDKKHPSVKGLPTTFSSAPNEWYSSAARPAQESRYQNPPSPSIQPVSP